MMKQKKHRKIPALAAGTTLVAAMTLMASCSTDYEDQIVYNDIEKPFQEDFKKDTVVFEKLPAEQAKHILNLSDPSTEIVDKPDYTFHTLTAGVSPRSRDCLQKRSSKVCISAPSQAARWSASAKSAPCSYQQSARLTVSWFSTKAFSLCSSK